MRKSNGEQPPETTARALREIAHGQRLVHGDAESMWGWNTPAGRRRFARRAQLLGQAAGLAPGQRVLELGCGTGLFTEQFAGVGATVVGIDISPDLLERARARTRHMPNVTLVVGRFEASAVEGPFDAIVGSSVLHHLEVDAALARCRDLLRPGGRLALAEPNLLNPQVFIERAFRSIPPFRAYVSPDETAFVRFVLSRSLARAGFGEVVITPFDFLHPATPRPFMDAVGAIGRTCERLPGIREIAGSLLITARTSDVAGR